MSDFDGKRNTGDVDAILAELREKRKQKEVLSAQKMQKEPLPEPIAEKTPRDEKAYKILVEKPQERVPEEQREDLPPAVRMFREEIRQGQNKRQEPEQKEIVTSYEKEKKTAPPVPKAKPKNEAEKYESDPLYLAMEKLKEEKEQKGKAALEHEDDNEALHETEEPVRDIAQDPVFQEMFQKAKETKEKTEDKTEKPAGQVKRRAGETKELGKEETKEIDVDKQDYVPEKEDTGEIAFNYPEEDDEEITDTSEFKVDPQKAQETLRSMHLQTEVDDEFREFFGETVSITPPVMQEENGRRVFKKKEEQNIEEPDTGKTQREEEMPEIEFNSPDEAEALQEELVSLSSSLKVRTAITGLIAALLLYGAVAGTLHLPMPKVLTDGSPFYFILANTVLLIVSVLVSISTIIGGITGFFGNATADSLTAFSALGAWGQAVYYLVNTVAFSTGFVLFAPVAALALFFNSIGKSMMTATMAANFEDIIQPSERNVAYHLKDEDLAFRLSKGLGENAPVFLSSRPTAFMKGFLRNSFSERAGDRSSKVMAILIVIASVVSAAISLKYSGSVAQAVSSFSAVAVLGGAFSSTLISAVPARLTQGMAHKIGAVIPGWSAMQDLKDVNVVTVQDKDLFPEGTVVLHGIKTFEKERIDLAILYAASVLIEGSPTLRGIFLEVIEDNRNMLYTVENLQYESGCGFTAWIENNRVIVGNREIMRRYEIDLPSLDYENKFTKNGERKPIYLSVMGKLFGMFIVSYHPDEAVEETLYDLERSGIAVAVRGKDFCITSELVSEVYEIPASYVKVLSAEEQEQLAPYTNYTDEAEGAMAHLDSFASLIGGLRAALAGYSMEKMATMLQWTSIVVSIAVGLFLSFTGGLPRISVAVICLYLGVWAVIAAAVPAVLKRY